MPYSFKTNLSNVISGLRTKNKTQHQPELYNLKCFTLEYLLCTLCACIPFETCMVSIAIYYGRVSSQL